MYSELSSKAQRKIPLPLPIVISREDTWFIASCPVLGLVTQGKDEIEVKENMKDLLEDYMSDPDTPKPKLEVLMSIEMSTISVGVPEGVLHSIETQTSAKA